MQSWIILLFWWLSILANGCLIFRLASQRLIRRYPFFAFMTGYQLGLSLLLLSLSGALPHPHPYTEIWNASQQIGGVIQVGVVGETFWALANYLRDRRFARKLLCFLAVLAAVVSGGVGLLGRSWSAAYRSSLLLSEHIAVALLCVCFLSLAFIDHAGIAIRSNLRAHVTALSVWFGSSFFANFLMDATAGHLRFISNLLIVAGQLAAFVLWSWRLTGAGERVPQQPAPRLSVAEFEAYEAESKIVENELSRLSSSFLRKMVEPKRR